MQTWEFVHRLLKSSTAGSSFIPGLVANQYRKDLLKAGEEDLPTASEFIDWAEALSEDMQEAGLIEPSGKQPGSSAGIQESMILTEFGCELYEALQSHNGILLFESMMVDIEASAIQQVLHQLNS